MSLSLVRPTAQLLLLDGERVPGGQVVQVLLHDDVAAAGERRVLVADHDGRAAAAALRVLGAVDEPEQVALVERLEAVHLVDDLARSREAAP